MPINAIQPGDLLFFGDDGVESIHHDAIYIGNGEMIEASQTGTPIHPRLALRRPGRGRPPRLDPRPRIPALEREGLGRRRPNVTAMSPTASGRSPQPPPMVGAGEAPGGRGAGPFDEAALVGEDRRRGGGVPGANPAVEAGIAVIDATADGSGRAHFYVGEAGLGKTSLLQMAKEAAGAGVAMVTGRGEAMEALLPLGLVAQVMSGLGRSGPRTSLFEPAVEPATPHHRVFRHLQSLQGRPMGRSCSMTCTGPTVIR